MNDLCVCTCLACAVAMALELWCWSSSLTLFLERVCCCSFVFQACCFMRLQDCLIITFYLYEHWDYRPQAMLYMRSYDLYLYPLALNTTNCSDSQVHCYILFLLLLFLFLSAFSHALRCWVLTVYMFFFSCSVCLFICLFCFALCVLRVGRPST